MMKLHNISYKIRGIMVKVSNIKAIITEKDLENIFNDLLINYAKVKEVKINKVLINDEITITGAYSMKINIPFEVRISIIEVVDNKITLLLQSVSIKKISINRSIKKFILKRVISEFQQIGIVVINDIVRVDLDMVCKVIQLVHFNLLSVNLIPGGIEAELKNFNFRSDELDTKSDKVKDGKGADCLLDNTAYALKNNPEKACLENEKNFWSYSTAREKISKRFPQKYNKLQEFILLMPDILALLLRLYKDKRVNSEIKLTISIAITYLLCPVDILPDWIPLLGTFDDITVMLFILNKIFCNISEEVILDNWEGEKNIVEVVKKYVEILSRVLGIKKINSLINFCSRILEKGYKFFIN